MNNIEPGCICRVVGKTPNSKNYGKIVTVIKKIPKSKRVTDPGDLWQVDRLMVWGDALGNTLYLREYPAAYLQRIDDGGLTKEEMHEEEVDYPKVLKV